MKDFNRFNDAFMKYLLAKNERRHLTLSLINAVFTDSDTPRLVDLEFIDRELSPQSVADKTSHLDVLGKCSDGTLVNVEVQVSKIDAMDKRTLFYWSRLYNRLFKGEDYSVLRRTVCINILSHVLFEDIENFHNCFGVTNLAIPSQRLTDVLEIHFVEVPKFEKFLRSGGKMSTTLAEWLMYLSNKVSDADRAILAANNPDIAEAMEAEKVFRMHPELMWEYEKNEKARRDAIAIRRTAINEGHAEGLAEGRAEGHAEGLVEGKATGEKTATLKNLKALMLSLNVDADKAMSILQIPAEDRSEYLNQLG